ncbi:hypothetical protein Mapa_007903 [Marchantia paleacea]|nr:hypothetical protein Mapa_007903 [Marchantia paleacea]
MVVRSHSLSSFSKHVIINQLGPIPIFLGEINEVAFSHALVVAIRLLNKILVELLGHASHLDPLLALVHQLPNPNPTGLRQFHVSVRGEGQDSLANAQILPPDIALARSDNHKIAVALQKPAIKMQ